MAGLVSCYFFRERKLRILLAKSPENLKARSPSSIGPLPANLSAPGHLC